MADFASVARRRDVLRNLRRAEFERDAWFDELTWAIEDGNDAKAYNCALELALCASLIRNAKAELAADDKEAHD